MGNFSISDLLGIGVLLAGMGALLWLGVKLLLSLVRSIATFLMSRSFSDPLLALGTAVSAASIFT